MKPQISIEVLATQFSSLDERVKKDAELNREEHGDLGKKIEVLGAAINELRISQAIDRQQTKSNTRILAAVFGVAATLVSGSFHLDKFLGS